LQTYHHARPANRPLFILGEFNSPVSYNFLARMLVEAMARSNMRIAIDSRCILGELCPDWMRSMEAHSTPGDWKMWIYPLSQLWEKGVDPRHPLAIDKRTIVFTMWESPNLRKEWVEQLNQAALIIVPCTWNKATFLMNGVTAPILVVPLGCNIGVYRPGHPARDQRDGQPCTFATAGALTGGGWRKNHVDVARAFQQAFPTEQDVRLHVKVTSYDTQRLWRNPPCEGCDLCHGRGITTCRPEVSPRGLIDCPLCTTYELRDPLLQLDAAHLADDRIEVIDSFMEDEQQADWYRGLDALVNASSGEGFGLHLLEAMACGTPLVSMEWSGETEFFSEKVGYPLVCGDGYRLAEVPPFRMPYHGCWIEPQVEAIARRMRRVYENRGEARAKGEEAAKVAARFTWTAVGERLRVKVTKFIEEASK
jgi:glycosyltransferase involved in cell wall biosynthesis